MNLLGGMKHHGRALLMEALNFYRYTLFTAVLWPYLHLLYDGFFRVLLTTGRVDRGECKISEGIRKLVGNFLEIQKLLMRCCPDKGSHSSPAGFFCRQRSTVFLWKNQDWITV